MPPKVSICIPTYNQTEYLRKTLESVLSQDFKDYELIITDDSDSLAVANLIQSYHFGNKLRYFKNQKCLNSPENWNFAIRLALGEYVKILHHDDWFYENTSLRSFVNLLDQHPESVFAFGRTTVWTHGSLHLHPVDSFELEKLAQTPEYLFIRNCIGSPSATIFRNGLHLNFDRNLRWLVDVEFYIRILMHYPSFAFHNAPLIYTANQASHQVTQQYIHHKENELTEYFYLFKRLELADKIPDRYSFVFKRLFQKYKIYQMKELTLLPDKISKNTQYVLQKIIWEIVWEERKKTWLLLMKSAKNRLKKILKALRILPLLKK
ncbi:MAG: glycosyltransferase [Microscillaceae bacterium]|nr:glycosyltransferase [Microscillaceae bacterium]